MNKKEICTEVTYIIESKLEKLQELISGTRLSNSETKSSMGDKYETGREMLQQEINKLEIQAGTLQQMLAVLRRISVAPHSRVQSGSLVETDASLFYISVSAGEFSFQNRKIFAVSAESPVAKMMTGLQKGDSFELNGIKQHIRQVF